MRDYATFKEAMSARKHGQIIEFNPRTERYELHG